MSVARGLPRRVLAVGAHPDDLELACAGTLARFRDEGAAVVLAVACRGDKGGAPAGGERLEDVRRRETLQAAALLGAPVEFLGLGDAEVRDTPETRRLFVSLLRRSAPEVLITHGPDDYHEDHVRVGRLAEAAAWFAASAGHVTPEPPLAAPPAVVFMENVAGMNFEPTHLVDVTPVMDLKRRMLACHASQLARPDGGLAPLGELAETLARLRGFQCGVRYAEGFRPAALWGRRRPEPLFP